jgi:hypothetical protein
MQTSAISTPGRAIGSSAQLDPGTARVGEARETLVVADADR